MLLSDLQEQPNFRIFIDAATLKQSFAGRPLLRLRIHFRIFIDAATLKPGSKTTRFTTSELYFRIFIDAATLKLSSRPRSTIPRQEFPHLYRCGHIEAFRRFDDRRRDEGISASL